MVVLPPTLVILSSGNLSSSFSSKGFIESIEANNITSAIAISSLNTCFFNNSQFSLKFIINNTTTRRRCVPHPRRNWRISASSSAAPGVDLTTLDSAVSKSHAGKVVERHWYEKNKHIFPASRWEIYDPTKKWERYTIHGD